VTSNIGRAGFTLIRKAGSEVIQALTRKVPGSAAAFGYGFPWVFPFQEWT
jgi:hypothetical protein